MELFLEQLINGLALGSLYALFGLGFGIVFSTLGILNAAHGTYASWAAIIALEAVQRLGLPFLPALLAGDLRRRAAGAAGRPDRVPAAAQPRRRGHDRRADHQHRCWIILDSLAGTATGHESLSFPRGSYPGTDVPSRLHPASGDADHHGGLDARRDDQPAPADPPQSLRRGDAGGGLEPDRRLARRRQPAPRGGDHRLPGGRDFRTCRRARRHQHPERLVLAGRRACCSRASRPWSWAATTMCAARRSPASASACSR